MCKKFLLLFLGFLILFNVNFGQDFLTLESLAPLLQRSPIYRIYESQYQNSLNSYYLSKSSLNSQISLQMSYSQGESQVILNNISSISESKNGNISLSYSKVLLPWGQAGINLKSSEINLTKSQNELKNNYANLYYQLVQYFYNLYLTQEQLKIYEESYNLAKKQREVAERQFRDGLINEINLLDYKQKEKLAEVSYINAQNTLELNYKNLETLLGSKVPRIPVKIDLDYKPITESPETLISVLHNQNITIKNALLDVEQAKLSLEKANLPSWNISLIGNYNTGNTSLGFSFDTQNYILNINIGQSIIDSGKSSSNTQSLWNVKLVFSTPLYDGGSKKYSIAQANISLNQAQLNLERAKNDVELNFWKLYYSLLQSQGLIEQKRVVLEQKKTNLEAQRIRFNLGLITEFDLKSYEIDVMQAEYELKNTILNYKLQLLQLDILLGR